MRARRQVLDNVALNDTTHVGLWLDRYLSEQNDQSREGEGEKAKHIKSVEKGKPPVGYREAFKRWVDTLPTDGTALHTPITAHGRIALGLGNKGVLENGLHLDHTWGVPVIPGSALKGLAAAAAHKLAQNDDWRKGGSAHDRRNKLHAFLFGQGGAGRVEGGDTADCIGAVRFLDAWWIPFDEQDREEKRLPIDLDIMTVHHADYYLDRGHALPLDTDSPNPVPFATISGRYLLALELTFPRLGDEDGDDAGWLEVAMQLLEKGLEELGIGAKTNAGYGRMSLKLPEKSVRQLQAEAREAARPPEDRWADAHRALLAKPIAERAEWLLKDGRAVPAGFTDISWRGFLTAAFADALAFLQQGRVAGASSEDLEAQLADLKRRVHTQQQSKAGKSEKEKGKINKEIEGLQKQQANLTARLTNVARDAEKQAAAQAAEEARRQAFLAWYRGEG